MSDKKTNGKSKVEPKETVKEEKPTCGIIMPISSIDGCSAEHWADVLSILENVIQDTEFEDKLVSDAGESGIIQKRIIQNLYSNEMVICDVSGKNPNVMFELGLRLAFDKPTIIIKDDKTDYSFDTSVIEHITYPRDLRFTKITSFKSLLKDKIEATHQKNKQDKNYSTFLKHFGQYKITNLEQKEVTSDKYILSTLEDLKSEVSSIKRNQLIERNMKKHSKHAENEARAIVKRRIDQFVKKNKLNSHEDVFIEDMEPELFKFLEDFDDIRHACGNPDRLEELMHSIIEPF